MFIHKRLTTGFLGRLKNFVPVGLVLTFLVVLVHVLAGFSGDKTTAAHAQQNPGPVITPTLTTEELIAAYIAEHIVQADIMPTPSPEATSESPAAVDSTSDYAVTLNGDQAVAGQPGELVTYTLTLSNTGTSSDVYDVTAVANWSVNLPTDVFTLSGGTASDVVLTVQIPPAANPGDTDTAVITAQSRNDGSTNDTVNVTTFVATSRLYMPIVSKPYPPAPTPSLSSARPNSANHWTMNWSVSNNQYISGYELQQSQDPAFTSGVTTLNPGSAATSQLINSNQPSANNVYYFRIRALGLSQDSGWSNTVEVTAAYYDDFSSNQTGWSGPSLKNALRRLTYLETTDTWYENGTWLIFRVKDNNDWAIASPMKRAPELPYAIEFRSQPASLVPQVSHGVVFGGDWTGAPCPDWSSFDGLYKHHNCFNHFYNTNLIWGSGSKLTLLWERIDALEWCLNCSVRLKRLGDVSTVGNLGVNASDWNTYRVEVRATDIKFFVNGVLKHTYTDTRWVNDRYFGVFASTDSLNNSTWRYDYFRVTPLDS
jgi:hypothetical protein